MSWKLGSEIKMLLHSPVVAINALRSLLQQEEAVEKSKADKIIIDDDGNATLNFENPVVRKEFEAHVIALSKMINDKTESPSV